MLKVESIGSENVFTTDTVGGTDLRTVLLDSTHICVAYENDSNSYASVIVGTIDGGDVTWGSDQVFYNDDVFYLDMHKIDSTHIVLTYCANDSFLYKIGTISGSTISWGSQNLIKSGSWQTVGASCLLDSTHIFTAYRDMSPYYFVAKIGTITGNTISWGAEYTVDSVDYASIINLLTISDTKVCICYWLHAAVENKVSKICDISGSVISTGSSSLIASNISYGGYLDLCLLSSNKIVTIFRNGGGGTSGDIEARVSIGTVDGSDVSWTTPTSVVKGNVQPINVVAINSSHISFSYSNPNTSPFNSILLGEVGSSSVTWQDEVAYNGSYMGAITSQNVFSDSLISISYRDPNNTKGTLRFIDLFSGTFLHVSDLYKLSSKGNLRGKASEGFIRPTLKQFFTSENFEEITSEPTGYTDDLCEGGTVTASSFSYGHIPSGAFDNNTGVGYQWSEIVASETATNWIQYQFTSIKKIRKVRIWSVYGLGFEAIKDFSIQASNTNSFTGEEVVLYSGQHPNDTTNSFVDYTFNNNNNYLYYRVVPTSHYYGNGSNDRGIQEIEMMEGTYG